MSKKAATQKPDVDELVRFTRILASYGCVNGPDAEPEESCDLQPPTHKCGPCEALDYLRLIGREREVDQAVQR